jgi:SAM-dependent methyltransferase
MERQEWNKMWSSEGSATHDAHGHEAPSGLLVQVAGARPPGRALDLGCGVGSNVIWLAQQGWDAAGVDFAEAAIARARARAAERGVAATFTVGDLRKLEPDGSYDLVTLFFLHLPDDQRKDVLRRAAAAVAPSGRLLFVGHDASDPDFVDRHIAAHGHHEQGQVSDEERAAELKARLTSPAVVAAELREAGLTVEREEIVMDDAHSHGDQSATTLVLARRS